MLSIVYSLCYWGYTSFKSNESLFDFYKHYKNVELARLSSIANLHYILTEHLTIYLYICKSDSKLCFVVLFSGKNGHIIPGKLHSQACYCAMPLFTMYQGCIAVVG